MDRCKNPGITSVMKGWISLNPRKHTENAGWMDVEEKKIKITNKGYFDVFIPLNMIFGFAEDYRKIIVNVKHELILRRSNTDVNAILSESYQRGNPAEIAWEKWKIELTKIEWMMPYVFLSAENKIRMLNLLQKSKPVRMSFHS